MESSVCTFDSGGGTRIVFTAVIRESGVHFLLKAAIHFPMQPLGILNLQDFERSENSTNITIKLLPDSIFAVFYKILQGSIILFSK